MDDMKNTSRYVFSLGLGVVLWCSEKQKIIVQSCAEGEYISTDLATQQAIWLKRILEDFCEKKDILTIHCDNKSTIAMDNNLVYHERTKHITIKHHLFW